MSGFIAERMYAARVWRLIAAASLIVASLAVAYSVGRAQPTTPPEIEACVNKFTGVTRLSPTGNSLSCQPHENLRTWNAVGEPGPAGQDGQDGLDGQNGAPGVDGISGYEIVTERFALLADTNVILGTLACPEEKKILSGGFTVLQNTWNILESEAVNDQIWNALAKGPAALPTGTEALEITLICGNVAE